MQAKRWRVGKPGRTVGPRSGHDRIGPLRVRVERQQARVRSALWRAQHRRSVPSGGTGHIDDRSADDAFAELLFPGGVDDADRLVIASIVERHGFTAAAAREILGAFDRRRLPSPFEVRAAERDLAVVDVDGFELLLDPADRSVSASLWQGRTWEPHIASTLRHWLAPGSTFVDVGANIGYHTFVGAAAVGPSGRVVAIEANQSNSRLLASSIGRNGVANVRLLPLAVGARPGYEWFREAIGTNGGFRAPGDGTALGVNDLVVPVSTLDDLDLGRVDLVKIDVEGAEALVLEGATATLEANRPVLVLEFSVAMTEDVAGVSAADHLEHIVGLGYDLSIIDPTDGRAQSVGSPSSLLSSWDDRYRIVDLLATPI